jgi:large subunit ribosomal protein L25
MLEGIVRDSITKPAVKALRKDGYLIANIYGKGMRTYLQHSKEMSILSF